MPITATIKDLHEKNPNVKLDYLYECSKKYKWQERTKDRIAYESKQIQELQQAELMKFYQNQIRETTESNKEIDEIIRKLNKVIQLKLSTILDRQNEDKPINKELERNKLTSLLMAHEKLITSKHTNTKILLRTLGQPETLREKDEDDTNDNEAQVQQRQTKTADNIINLIKQGSGKIEREEINIQGEMEDESKL